MITKEGVRTEEAGEVVNRLLGLDPPLQHEVWHRVKGWYWAAVHCAPPPAQVTLERITAEQVDLYCYVPPLRDNISISVDSFPAEDLVTKEDKIEWAVKRLCNH